MYNTHIMQGFVQTSASYSPSALSDKPDKPGQTEPAINAIVSNVKKMYNTHKVDYPENDIMQLFEDRVPAFVERSLREMRARRVNKVQIEECVKDLYQQCANRYVYNREQNAFYIVQDAPVSLQLISSDQILISLREQLPANLEHCRTQILRMIRTRLQTQNVFEWTPPPMVMQRMTKEVHRNFNTSEETSFFMKLIGAMVHHREDVLYTDDNKNSMVHLWFGERVGDVIECVQRLLYNATKSLSPFWNKVKRRMHRSYPYSNICFVHFPPITHKSPFRIIKHSPILFLATCSHMFTNDQNFLINTPNIRRTQHISTSQQLFSHYLHENMVLTNNETTNNKQKYLLLHEILNDFAEYTSQQSLPQDVMTKNDIIQSIQMLIHNETYGTRGTKRLYYATFRISTGETLHELFHSFCQTMLDFEQQPSDSQHPCAHITHRVTAMQLHNNYRMWCKHYVATNDTIDSEICPQADTQCRHWYCSYKLFTVLIQKMFGVHEEGFPIIVHPPADIWKIYLQKHTNDSIQTDLHTWVQSEFGIRLQNVCTSANHDLNTTTPILEENDLDDLNKHIEAYVLDEPHL